MRTPARSSDLLGPWTGDADGLAGSFREARPFRHAVIDGFLKKSFAEELLAAFPPYDDARFRNANGDRGKAYREDVRALGPVYERLDDLLKSSDFLELMSRLTGVPGLTHDPFYLGGGTHENGDDMELDPHVDFTVHPNSKLHRRVNLLLYLNPEWGESWGGRLELHDDPWGQARPVKVFSPVFNRCVLFETHDHSWHGVNPLSLPPGVSRRSFALYLYTKEPAPGVRPIPSDMTVFVPRPVGHLYREGMTLEQTDLRRIQRAFARRDWLLQHLYDRSLELANRLYNAEGRLLNAATELASAKGERK